MLADRCQRRIMLTGTPLQNDLGELHSLLQFLLPTVFRNERRLEEAQVHPVADPDCVIEV